MAIGKRKRFEIFKRDSFTCQYCGKSAPDTILHVDHIQPTSKGGSDNITNLITSCRDCNLGKSNIELSDDTAIKKRKAQLDELQERREQLDLMLEWHKSLIDMDQIAINKVAEFFDELYDGSYTMNDNGREDAKKWLKKFSLNEILSAMRDSFKAYGKNPYKVLEFTPKICTIKRAEKDKPYLKDVFYIRGIIKNRFYYCNERIAKEMLEAAFIQNIDKGLLREIAIDCKNWTEWRNTMQAIMDE